MDRRKFYDLWAWEYTRRNVSVRMLAIELVQARDTAKRLFEEHPEYDTIPFEDIERNAQGIIIEPLVILNVFYVVFGYFNPGKKGYTSDRIMDAYYNCKAGSSGFLPPVESRALYESDKMFSTILKDESPEIKRYHHIISLSQHSRILFEDVVEIEAFREVLRKRNLDGNEFRNMLEERVAIIERKVLSRKYKHNKIRFGGSEGYESRAVGLWLWDYINMKRMTQESKVKKQEAFDAFEAVFPRLKKDRERYTRFHLRTQACIDACEVLSI